LAFLALIALIFGFAACSNPAAGGGLNELNSPKSIRLDIENWVELDGKSLDVYLDTSDFFLPFSTTFVAVDHGWRIEGQTIIIDLYEFGTRDRWTGSGTFNLFLRTSKMSTEPAMPGTGGGCPIVNFVTISQIQILTAVTPVPITSLP
jgi:hypothetical protein